jgi:hypothetical protein
MAPLAPKPPFATDQPDSFYEQPQPRLRQPPSPNPNQRTSAYNLYVPRVPIIIIIIDFHFISDMTTILLMNLSLKTITGGFSPPRIAVLV